MSTENTLSTDFKPMFTVFSRPSPITFAVLKKPVVPPKVPSKKTKESESFVGEQVKDYALDHVGESMMGIPNFGIICTALENFFTTKPQRPASQIIQPGFGLNTRGTYAPPGQEYSLLHRHKTYK